MKVSRFSRLVLYEAQKRWQIISKFAKNHLRRQWWISYWISMFVRNLHEVRISFGIRNEVIDSSWGEYFRGKLDLCLFVNSWRILSIHCIFVFILMIKLLISSSSSDILILESKRGCTNSYLILISSHPSLKGKRQKHTKLSKSISAYKFLAFWSFSNPFLQKDLCERQNPFFISVWQKDCSFLMDIQISQTTAQIFVPFRMAR